MMGFRPEAADLGGRCPCAKVLVQPVAESS
jgi:hypothetical protein